MKETRRDFLRTGCAVVAGATVASGISLLSSRVAKASSADHPFGWPVGGLDVAETKDLGYQGFKGVSRFSAAAGKDCASATFGAIVGQLQEAVGEEPEHPYHGIPLSMMQWASAGVAGFASLCGTLNGACAAIGLVCSNTDAKGYIGDLLTWYSETALPIYPSPEYEEPHAQSKAESNLCHLSVTKWCLASGYGSGSPERADRCACISADVASKVAEILNSGVGGALGNPRDNSTICGACHYAGTDVAAGQFTRGKMNCHSCHVNITKTPAHGHDGGK